MDFKLFPATPGDVDFLSDLFRDVRAPEFAALALPATALDQLLDMQFQAQISGYAAQFPDAKDQIVWVARERAGRLLVDASADSIRVVDIALLSGFRGQGIGTRLLQEVCAVASEKKLPVVLTVRYDNPAEHLYSRAGFVRTGGDGLHYVMEWQCREALHPLTPQPAKDDEGTLEPGLNARYFRTLVGTPLQVHNDACGSVPLMLESVELIRPRGRSRETDNGQTDSFTLYFHGPLEPVLPAAMSALTSANAEAMELFLVPHGPSEGRMRYSAIFNRLIPS